jgi:hypothetical protein
MKSREIGFEGLLSLGGRRHVSPAERERKAFGFFSPRRDRGNDDFAEAIRKLSAEDEEMPVPDGPGPIVFKDGIFQIDVSNTGSSSDIDPALKGLIDSILG